MTQPSDSRLDYVPLSAIHYNPAINARRDTETDVTELAATIDAQNIGQPLLLRPSEREGYEPVDGGRRLRALKLLAEQGKLSPDHPVPAYIRELDDTEAMSLSLATVITRMDLHPADEALDFNDLVKQGMKPDDIAARFGIPIRRVKQRLAIGRLPREIVDALKAGQIGLADAQAYTLLHDPGHATKLFKAGIREEWAIKKEFSKARVPGDSPEAVYVGREAYVAAIWQPDVEFYKRMPRESLAAALGEAAIAGVTPSKKKKELVETAVRELTPKGWLPKPLRTPSYKGPGSNAWADAQGAAAVEQLSKEKAA